MDTSNQKPNSAAAEPEVHAATPEHALRAARVQKAETMRQRGVDPFTNDIDPHTLTDLGTLRNHYAHLRDGGGKYGAELVAGRNSAAPWRDHVVIAGRIVASRSFGKASFLRLRDRSGEIQLFCRQNVLGEHYAVLHDLDVGDIVTASGTVMVTKTGELSIDVKSIRMLTKAYRGLPEKWHGLSDVEARHRHRYIDLIANPGVRNIFKARSLIVRALREYLDGNGFLEVETPTMGTIIGGATAKPFCTHHNALDLDLFMRIAPELNLKRLVVGGIERVYEIGRCYRNEGLSTRHNPEFTMLEFYQAYASYQTLMGMTEEMLREVDKRLAGWMPEEHAAWSKERKFRIDEPFVRMNIVDLIKLRMTGEVDRKLQEIPGHERTQFSLLGLNETTLLDPELLAGVFAKGCEASSPLSSTTKKQLRACESHGERIFLLYELMVEPNLICLFAKDNKSIPVFVTDHPVEVSPLARRHSRPGTDPNSVERFELFVHGRELCNAFSELNDPEDQARRFSEQVARKARGAEETMDYDEDYINALEHGLPPTAGFGMGIDRLAMMLTGQESIREVILFPLLRPER